MNYRGSGNIKLFGCGPVTLEKYYPFKFPEMSKVYVLAEAAQEGELVPVVIRRVFLHPGGTFTYQDTLKGLWLESELCTQSVAIATALNYWQQQQAKVTHKLETC